VAGFFPAGRRENVLKLNRKIQRRAFLARVAGLGLGGAACLGHASFAGLCAAGMAGGPLRLDAVTCAEFAAHLGSKFRVWAESGETAEIKLFKAEELPDWAQRHRSGELPSRRVPFSLLFLGTKDSGLKQACYRLEHRQLGRFDLFLVALGPDQRGRVRYEAVFG
jgi:hypothetical protein